MAMAEGAGLDSWISLAGALADASGSVIRKHFRHHSAVETKTDGSPVTVADREAELVMRAAIEAAFPDHGIRGEEFADHNGQADTVWVLDPIDGTRSFLTGKPVFTTLIAVLHHGTPVLGLIDQPVTRERWVGSASHPTTWNGATARVRPCASLERAAMYTTSTEWCGPEERDAFERLRRKALMTLFSADAYAFGLLTSGHIDVAIECQLDPHDFLALVPVVEGAGGAITDWEGNPLDPHGKANILATGDSAVHKEAMAVLAAGG